MNERSKNVVKNLAQLKRTLVKGAEFEIIVHARKEYVGQRRMVNAADSTGIYSIIPDQPDSKVTLANNGKGSWLGWSRASFWKFNGDICTLYDSNKDFTQEHIIISIKVV